MLLDPELCGMWCDEELGATISVIPSPYGGYRTPAVGTGAIYLDHNVVDYFGKCVTYVKARKSAQYLMNTANEVLTK